MYLYISNADAMIFAKFYRIKILCKNAPRLKNPNNHFIAKKVDETPYCFCEALLIHFINLK